MEETKVTTGDAGFRSANAVQEIRGGVLKHIATAAGADRYILNKVTEVVEKLTKNNASLTTQLSNAMKLNIEIAKRINIKYTQGQYLEVKILVEKEKIKAAFIRKLDPDGYCWTHGFRVTKRHKSQTCSTPAAVHQRTASRTYHGRKRVRKMTQQEGDG